jgi:integrase/recombinase XerD
MKESSAEDFMERIYKRTHTIQTFRSGPLGPYLLRFVENSTQHGYARESIHVQLRCLVRFGRWLKRRRIPLRNVGRTDIQRYLRHDGDVRQGDARTLRRFLQLLGEQGVIVMPDTQLKTQVEIVAENFADYLKYERGLAPRTIEYHRAFVARFLAWRFGPSGDHDLNLAHIQGGDLITFVQREAAKRSVGSARMITASLRSFVKYSLVQGALHRDISGAIPKVRCYSLSGIPRFLTPSQVRRVLASCDRRTAMGRRDFAILLLLSRLGLRACEVGSLELDDFDWTAGTLTIRGKGSKICKLPLPHDVGKAIATYLRRDRPVVPNRRVFLRILAPHTGFAGPQGVCQMVRETLARAGVESRSKGAHQFRHSLATRMLANRASLADIGQVLRHARPKTTFVYTKIDVRALRALVRRWPGGAK